jgi:hypothetical protein
MRGRARAAVDATWVRHVGLVIRRVEVHTVPAAREEHLSSEAIRAIRVRESWRLRLCRAVEVNAKSICFRMSFDIGTQRKEGADQSQEMARDASVPVSFRAYGFPVSIRSPSGKGCTVSFEPLRWR